MMPTYVLLYGTGQTNLTHADCAMLLWLFLACGIWCCLSSLLKLTPCSSVLFLCVSFAVLESFDIMLVNEKHFSIISRIEIKSLSKY